MATLADAPTEEEMREARGELEEGAEAEAENLDENGPKAPDFLGETVKDVMQQAAAERHPSGHAGRRSGACSGAGGGCAADAR